MCEWTFEWASEWISEEETGSGWVSERVIDWAVIEFLFDCVAKTVIKHLLGWISYIAIRNLWWKIYMVVDGLRWVMYTIMDDLLCRIFFKWSAELPQWQTVDWQCHFAVRGVWY